jgi:hypothetical protein
VAGVTTTTTCKPGYGHGDKNHVHCGPPGLQGRNGPKAGKQTHIASRLISSSVDSGGFGLGAVILTALLAGLALVLRRRFRMSR